MLKAFLTKWIRGNGSPVTFTKGIGNQSQHSLPRVNASLQHAEFGSVSFGWSSRTRLPLQPRGQRSLVPISKQTRELALLMHKYNQVVKYQHTTQSTALLPFHLPRADISTSAVVDYSAIRPSRILRNKNGKNGYPTPGEGEVGPPKTGRVIEGESTPKDRNQGTTSSSSSSSNSKSSSNNVEMVTSASTNKKPATVDSKQDPSYMTPLEHHQQQQRMYSMTVVPGRAPSGQPAQHTEVIAEKTANKERFKWTVSRPRLSISGVTGSLSSHQSKKQKSFWRRHKVATGFVIGVILTGIMSTWEVETIPYSGRLRLRIMSRSFEQYVAELMDETVEAQVEGQLLDEKSWQYQIVKRITSRLCFFNELPELPVHIVQDSTPNAFVTGAGSVYVNTGLFDVATNEHEMALVLGHEIGHYVARHFSENVVIAAALRVVTAVVDPQSALLPAILEVAVSLPKSRTMESEADQIGLMLMANACYDITQAKPFWEKMAVVEDDARNGGSSKPPSGATNAELKEEDQQKLDEYNETKSEKAKRRQKLDKFNERKTERAKRRRNLLESYLSTHPLTSDRMTHFEDDSEWMQEARERLSVHCPQVRKMMEEVRRNGDLALAPGFNGNNEEPKASGGVGIFGILPRLGDSQ
eukprot:Clim_evm7s43 gene=Clim_evmTU7s43